MNTSLSVGTRLVIPAKVLHMVDLGGGENNVQVELAGGKTAWFLGSLLAGAVSGKAVPGPDETKAVPGPDETKAVPGPDETKVRPARRQPRKTAKPG